MMTGSEISSDHHISCLTAMRLDALHKVGEVFARAERTFSNNLVEDTELFGFFKEERELRRLDSAYCHRYRTWQPLRREPTRHPLPSGAG